MLLHHLLFSQSFQKQLTSEVIYLSYVSGAFKKYHVMSVQTHSAHELSLMKKVLD